LVPSGSGGIISTVVPLYFAYGSNMDRAAMAARCPASRPLGVARLARHRFVITCDGYASVVRDPRRMVWGVLWDLALADVRALDRYECIATGLYRKLNQPVLATGGARRALLYVASKSAPGQARTGYVEGIAAAAREAGLPASYIAEVEAWLPNAAPARQTLPLERPVRPLWSSPLAKDAPAKDR
jgi:AIG2-like family